MLYLLIVITMITNHTTIDTFHQSINCGHSLSAAKVQQNTHIHKCFWVKIYFQSEKTLNSQLITDNSQLTTVNCQLTIVNCRTRALRVIVRANAR